MEHAQRMDGFGELLAEVGNTRQYGNVVVNLGGAFSARAEYARGGLVARIVDIPADMATAQGVTIEHATDTLLAEIDRLQVMQQLSDGLRWSLLDGGGALIPITQDSGGGLDRPLDPGRLQRIEEFRVVSCINMRGERDTAYSDPTKANFGQPQYYLIDAASAPGAAQYRVHETRVIPIPGAPQAVIAGVDLRDIPWYGRGVSSAALRAIERYRNSLRWSEKLLERSQQAVHKMKGLSEMLMAKQEGVVRQRINLVDANRSALNGVAVDAEDDYTITSVGLAGVKDIVEQNQSAVAAETGYPVTLLFGRSPGGLNSTGEGDWTLVYTAVEQIQRRRASPALERILSLILAQSSMANSEKPSEWSFKWNPLAPLTRQQLAEIENKEADTLNKTATAIKTAVDTGALSQDEAHEYLQGEGAFGLEQEVDGTGAGARKYAGETE